MNCSKSEMRAQASLGASESDKQLGFMVQKIAAARLAAQQNAAKFGLTLSEARFWLAV